MAGVPPLEPSAWGGAQNCWGGPQGALEHEKEGSGRAISCLPCHRKPH